MKTINEREMQKKKKKNKGKQTKAERSKGNRNHSERVKAKWFLLCIVEGDSLLNGINERGLYKDFNVKVNNIPGGTNETVLEKIDELVKCKASSLIVHAGTNDLTKGKNVLNNVKKIVKEVKRISPNTKIAFSSITIRKDKKGIDKNVVETNARL